MFVHEAAIEDSYLQYVPLHDDYIWKNVCMCLCALGMLSFGATLKASCEIDRRFASLQLKEGFWESTARTWRNHRLGVPAR